MVWPARLNHPASFEVCAVYDAPAESVGGRFAVRIGSQMLAGTVRRGENVSARLGRVQLEPGTFELRVVPEEIVGGELMRLRSLVLTSGTSGP